jgi:Ankyrin repeats (many copies)
MGSKWGPPGLETPTSYDGLRRLAIPAVIFAVWIGFSQYQKYFGWTDILTNDHSCAEAPSEIRAWMFNRSTRRPEQAVNLQKWHARHPDRINKQYGLSCDAPLHLAAKFGREDLAELLIAAGADIEARNEDGERPLHSAAFNGRPTVVKVLLAHGADVEARASFGKTALHAAAAGRADEVDGRLEVAKLLLAAGASARARESNGKTPLDIVHDDPRMTNLLSLTSGTDLTR